MNRPFIVRKCAEHAKAYEPGSRCSVYLRVPTQGMPVVSSRLFCVCEPSAKLWILE